MELSELTLSAKDHAFKVLYVSVSLLNSLSGSFLVFCPFVFPILLGVTEKRGKGTKCLII